MLQIIGLMGGVYFLARLLTLTAFLPPGTTPARERYVYLVALLAVLAVLGLMALLFLSGFLPGPRLP